MSDGGPPRERSMPAPSLLDRAGLPDLAPLWDEFARRVGASDRPVRAVRLTNLSAAEQEALADLLAWPRLPGPSVRVEVDALAGGFGIDTEGLLALLMALRGPLVDRASERERAFHDRERLWSEVATAVDGRGLQAWIARLRAGGVPEGDVETHRGRLRLLLSLVQQLPLRTPEALPIVAQRSTGDPHALDHGWLRTMLADAAATLLGLATPTDAESTRAALRGVGIVPDQLSVPVVCVGLRATGRDPVARYLDGLGAAHEPAALTAAQLRRWPVAVQHDRVWVVENPSVLQRIARSHLEVPVVCTSSWPTDAVVLLLDQVRASGASMHYHSDLDGAGLALTGHLIRRFGAAPWRMSVGDYLAAVDGARMPLVTDGPLPETPWDPALREAILEHRRVVYEEQVVDTLLNDLAY